VRPGAVVVRPRCTASPAGLRSTQNKTARRGYAGVGRSTRQAGDARIAGKRVVLDRTDSAIASGSRGPSNDFSRPGDHRACLCRKHFDRAIKGVIAEPSPRAAATSTARWLLPLALAVDSATRAQKLRWRFLGRDLIRAPQLHPPSSPM
jgi:hypothetical protein